MPAIVSNMSRVLVQSSSCARRYLASGGALKQTCLHDLHKRRGAKMGPFAGYDMPLLYSDLSVSDSVHHTRKHASIFDVSHMLQTMVTGKHAHEMMESLSTVNIQALKDNQGSLTVFTNQEGGILDDLIVNRVNDTTLYVVTNAACAEQDSKIMKDAASAFRAQGKDVTVEHMDEYGLVALQGPAAVKVLSKGIEKVDLSKLYFMRSATATLFGVKHCRVTRCGYTGEDGFEISVDPAQANNLCEQLLGSQDGKVAMAGLAARDVLRLEAGLCLYGHDIDESTSVVEGDLKWLLGKRRKENADFPGAQKVLAKFKDASLTNKVRVGFMSKGGRPAREKAFLESESGEGVGVVTSGSPSPTLSANIGMAYVKPEFAKPGTVLKAVISKTSSVKVTVTKMPFVPTNYFVPPKKK